MDYGFIPILGKFGSGKTLLSYLMLKDFKKRGYYIISNVPYDFVDTVFDSTNDLVLILESLFNIYISDNPPNKLAPLVIFIDELHIYFYAREVQKNFRNEKIRTIFSQLRKRNILITGTTQYIMNVDIFIRRFVDAFYFPRFYNLFNFVKFVRYDYGYWIDKEQEPSFYNVDDVWEKINKRYDFFEYIRFLGLNDERQKRLSYYIVGYYDILNEQKVENFEKKFLSYLNSYKNKSYFDNFVEKIDNFLLKFKKKLIKKIRA